MALCHTSFACEDEAVHFVFGLIADFFGGLMATGAADTVGERVRSGRDRRRLDESRVRSGLRSVEGRVLNIGTEWSEGIAEISPGRLRFIPRTGIVGDREITITGLALEGAAPRLLEGLTVLRITTPSGDLLWAVPDKLVDDIAELVVPD